MQSLNDVLLNSSPAKRQEHVSENVCGGVWFSYSYGNVTKVYLEHGPFPWVFFFLSQDIHSVEHIQMFDI